MTWIFVWPWIPSPWAPIDILSLILSIFFSSLFFSLVHLPYSLFYYIIKCLLFFSYLLIFCEFLPAFPCFHEIYHGFFLRLVACHVSLSDFFFSIVFDYSTFSFSPCFPPLIFVLTCSGFICFLHSLHFHFYDLLLPPPHLIVSYPEFFPPSIVPPLLRPPALSSSFLRAPTPVLIYLFLLSIHSHFSSRPPSFCFPSPLFSSFTFSPLFFNMKKKVKSGSAIKIWCSHSSPPSTPLLPSHLFFL